MRCTLLLLLSLLTTTIAFASVPLPSDKAAALKAATAWLALLDAPDFKAAAAAAADEDFDLHGGSSPAARPQAAAIMASMLSGQFASEGTPKVTRKLLPAETSQVSSCGCGIKDGDFIIFAYDVKYVLSRFVPPMRANLVTTKLGKQKLTMVKESDGSWKYATIDFQVASSQATAVPVH